MDMDTGSSSTTTMTMMMTPYLHFTGGDFLFFKSLSPTSKGAIAAASIVVFLIALFERFVAASRGVLEERWKQDAITILAKRDELDNVSSSCCDEKPSNVSPLKASAAKYRSQRTIAPFILKNDLFRGAFHAFQSLLRFILMLTVMTFQAAYILAIIAGLAIGETAFGRYCHSESGHAH